MYDINIGIKKTDSCTDKQYLSEKKIPVKNSGDSKIRVKIFIKVAKIGYVQLRINNIILKPYLYDIYIYFHIES